MQAKRLFQFTRSAGLKLIIVSVLIVVIPDIDDAIFKKMWPWFLVAMWSLWLLITSSIYAIALLETWEKKEGLVGKFFMGFITVILPAGMSIRNFWEACRNFTTELPENVLLVAATSSFIFVGSILVATLTWFYYFSWVMGISHLEKET